MKGKPLFDNVVIAGVGLIGGSMGLAMKKRGLAAKVTGVFRTQSSAAEALQKKAVDEAVFSLEEAAARADLVVLAAPVYGILEHLRVLPKVLRPSALVIDVGSSKALIEKEGRRRLGKRFIACHPMAGSEKRGVLHSDPELFEGSLCFLTTPHAMIEGLWRALGSAVSVVPAVRHDAWVAQSSHLPHLLAFALFAGIKPEPGVRFVNPSLRGLGRLAKSDPSLWAEVFASNRKPVLACLKTCRKELDRFAAALKAGSDRAVIRALNSLLKRARNNAQNLIPEE